MVDDIEAVIKGELSKEEFLERNPPPRPGPRLKRIDRKQSIFRSVMVEDLIGADHIARAIWEITEALDLKRYYGSIRAVEGVAGRERTDPRLLLAIWLYAYTEGVSSAREIERRCEYHPAYQWLCGFEVLNYHTLSSFRVENKDALEALFIDQLGLLSKEGFIDLTTVMHDGTRVAAQASGGSFKREPKLAEHLEIARRLVEELSDEEDGEEASKRQQARRKRARQEKLERLKLAQKELEKLREVKSSAKEKSEARVSETDPEARVMKQSNGGYAPGYNVQVTTDEQQKIIIAVAATQSGSDAHELTPAVARVAGNLGEKPLRMVVDGGFTNRGNIVAMAGLEVDLIGSLAERTSLAEAGFARRGIAPEFRGAAFEYHAESNSLSCPNNQVLAYSRKKTIAGAVEYWYRAPAKACGACPFKERCCPGNSEKGREVMRTVESAEVTAYREKMETEAAKALYRKRGEVAEFPNLWIKEKLGLRKFRLRGLEKVGMEALWACLTYNIQQWIRLSWRPKLKSEAAMA